MDLRSLMPWDKETVLSAVARGRVAWFWSTKRLKALTL
ncbi:MAG: hypothetical protein R2865_05545 [Deinococcales bacterium]